MKGTPNPESVSTRLERIAKLARQMPGTALRTLSHHIDIEWLKEAYRRTRKDGAAGVDEQSAKEYAANLEGNLQTLLDRAKSGDRYRAPPVRRVHIPKGDGRKTRPIGIPTFEDKVLQRSVAMVLEAVHEQDFLDCSYGFRPGRSAHDALRTLRAGMMEMAGGWVLEADIEAFFDSVNRNQLQQVLRQRVQDGVLLRLVGKWLNAGVMEEGQLHYPDAGTPQGGVISPLLANIFLHEVLDLWFERAPRYCESCRRRRNREASASSVSTCIGLDRGKANGSSCARQQARASRVLLSGSTIGAELTATIQFESNTRRSRANCVATTTTSQSRGTTARSTRCGFS
jgi:retron-type reverse transcriptase